jgi:membrane protease YdiL (CAAX protease family)
VSMSFPGCCGPSISPDIIIYLCLLHNQGGRFKIVSTISHVLCILLFKKGFMPSVLIVTLIFLGSMENLGFRESMFHHCVASACCLIILASFLCFSLCHRNNSDSLFANQHFKQGMIGKYQNTFLGPPFLLFLLQFSSSPASFLRLNQPSPQIGHFLRSSYSGL